MKKTFISLTLAVAAMSAAAPHADACSRVVYHGENGLMIVGRSLDWKTPIPTNLYVYPRGIEKQGNVTESAVRWTSKYGAVYAVSYDGGITEGMNEKGLVINGLFCKGTVYANDSTAGRPDMSLSVFVGWLLDMNATTREVVDVLKRQDFSISGATFDGGTVSALHWGITDASGETAILEFDHGSVRIYEGDSLDILTNDPTYPQMTAINNYWKNVGGGNMLPGTVKSPDRFVRASYFNNHVERVADPQTGVSIVRSVLQNVSVPYLYTVDLAAEPNVSSTQWRSFCNIPARLYYFDIVTNLGMYYIDLKKCDLRPGAKVMKLNTAENTAAVGEVNRLLVPSAPFTPMY